MGSPKQLQRCYLCGFRRGVVGMLDVIPRWYQGRWDFLDRQLFLEGHRSGVKTRKAAETRARKRVAQ